MCHSNCICKTARLCTYTGLILLLPSSPLMPKKFGVRYGPSQTRVSYGPGPSQTRVYTLDWDFTGSLPEMIWHWTGIRKYVPPSEFLGPYHCTCRRLVSYLVSSQCSLGIATDGGWKKTSVVQCRSRKALVPVDKRNPSWKSHKIGSSELTHFFLENQI